MPDLPEPSRRIDAVDVARGTALVAMAVFHAVWDLSLVGLVTEPIADRPGWQLFARCIAASFLVLVGVSLVLASQGGLRPRPFARRLAQVAAGAAAVSLATRYAVPDAWVFFGILHHIALASLLALPFLRLPSIAIAAVAALVASAPWWAASPFLDRPWLLFLGLGTAKPDSVDYVPLAPWFGAVLAGLVLGRALLRRAPQRLLAWRPRAATARWLAFAGRHGLLFYLVHQPVLLALLGGLAWAIGGPVDGTAGERAFVSECERVCTASGRPAATCRAACTCTAASARAEGLLAAAVAGRLGAAEQARMTALTRACIGEAAGP